MTELMVHEILLSNDENQSNSGLTVKCIALKA